MIGWHVGSHYWENQGYTMEELNKVWTQEELWNLRQQIPLCSMFVKDYVNTFHVDPECTWEFFDGYVEFLQDEMEELEENYNDEQFYDLLLKYDTPENLYNWWSDLENDMDDEWHCLPCPPGCLKDDSVKFPCGIIWKDAKYVPDNEPKAESESEE